MKQVFSAMFIRWQRLFCLAALGVCIVLVSVSLPLLFDLMSRGTGWSMGLFPRPDDLWKECPRCF
jgi:hypothetical protein